MPFCSGAHGSRGHPRSPHRFSSSLHWEGGEEAFLSSGREEPSLSSSKSSPSSSSSQLGTGRQDVPRHMVSCTFLLLLLLRVVRGHLLLLDGLLSYSKRSTAERPCGGAAARGPRQVNTNLDEDVVAWLGSGHSPCAITQVHVGEDHSEVAIVPATLFGGGALARLGGQREGEGHLQSLRGLLQPPPRRKISRSGWNLTCPLSDLMH